MLPLKWKVFRVLNYLQLIFAIGVIGLIIYSSSITRRGLDDGSAFTYLFIASFILMAASAILNIYITNRNFPDKPLASYTNTLHYFFLLFGIIINISLFILLIIGVRDTYNNEYVPGSVWFVLSIFILIWLINFWVIINQFQVKPFIRKNYQSNFSSLIDSIGKE